MADLIESDWKLHARTTVQLETSWWVIDYQIKSYQITQTATHENKQYGNMEDRTISINQLNYHYRPLNRFIGLTVTVWYDTIRDAILTCARKPTWVSLIYRTQPTTKKCKNRKTKSRKHMLRNNSKHSTQLNSTENYGRRCLTPLSPHRNYILS